MSYYSEIRFSSIFPAAPCIWLWPYVVKWVRLPSLVWVIPWVSTMIITLMSIIIWVSGSRSRGSSVVLFFLAPIVELWIVTVIPVRRLSIFHFCSWKDSCQCWRRSARALDWYFHFFGGTSGFFGSNGGVLGPKHRCIGTWLGLLQNVEKHFWSQPNHLWVNCL